MSGSTPSSYSLLIGCANSRYQSSWGIAEKVASMATHYLQSKKITAKL